KATKKVFIQNPLHNTYPEIVYKTGDLVYYNKFGELIFSGRIDSQIKHLGYRIELGEIENAALNIKSINRTCVLYDKLNSEIVLIFQTENSEINNNEIRKELTRYLPKYMLPTQFINLKEWPLNSNGKIDRKKLRKDFLN
ncbi:MAG: phenylalanine racemase, partial [Flavobacteriales bacterium]|nr:phenylalanine racemase [Flavobacteriales bacterium]